jgi:pyruvate ferredoxin oxidoreductase gamma subunit
MYAAGYLDAETFGTSIATPVESTLASDEVRAQMDPVSANTGPYFASLVHETLFEQFGVEKALTGGLRVYTTLDGDVQKFAEDSVAKRLSELDKKERRGAPLRAYTRSSRKPIRRHDAIEHPDAVVVLEPSLIGEANVVEGLAEDGIVIVDLETAPPELHGVRVACAPASKLAGERGSSFANVTMLGAVAAALGEPPLEAVQDAAVEVLAGKADAAEVRAAVAEGYACLR